MKALAASTVLLFVAACQTAPPALTEAEVAQVEAEVTGMANRLMDLWNTGDWETHLSLYDSEALNVLWGPTVLDTHESFARFMGFVEDYPGWDGAWDDIFVKVLGPNSALFRGRYHTTLTDLEGMKTFWRPHWTALVERRVDGWTMTVVDHAYGTAQEVPEEG
jgi:hypothetical protein